MKTKEGTYRFRIKRYDTGLSTQTAVGNVRRAVADGAVAIIDEGTGINASWRIAADADRPIGITYQGGRRPRRSGRAPQCLPDRADRSRDGVSLRRVPHPEGPQDRPRRRRLVLRPGRLEGSPAGFRGQRGLGCDQADRPDWCPGPGARGAAGTARGRDRAARLGRADHDRRRDRGRARIRLERPRLHAGHRRGSSRPPATREPPGLGRRPHLRGRAADRRGRGRTVSLVPARLRTARRSAARGREDAGRRAGRAASGLRDVLLRLRQRARRRDRARRRRRGPGEAARGDEPGLGPRARTATSAASTRTITKAWSTTTSTSRASKG